jgi:subtilisin family serine protease
MSRAHARSRVIALVAGAVVALSTTLTVSAAGPRPVVAPRPTGEQPAWERPDPRNVDGGTRLIIRYAPGTSAQDRRAAATASPTAEPVADVPSARIGVVALPADATPTEIATASAAIAATPSVQSVSVDHRRYRDLDPTAEPGWPELWAMENHGQRLFGGVAGTNGKVDVDLDATAALAVTKGDPSVVVAVIDDGIDFSHPDLATQAWTNPGESGGGKETNGVDDDGNGYIDDVHGWDFCHDDNTVHDPDDDFHGTHVAGTIAAALDGQGVVGIAPSVKLMALKFLGDDDACGFDSQAIEAIAYAKHFNVRIANNSWSGRGRLTSAPDLKAAIANSGMLFVVSAGNDGIDNDAETFPALPASWDLPNILSVAAIDNKGALADFSNYGKVSVDIAAPGVAILSSVPAYDGDHGHLSFGWDWLDGTSMAAPHVTGTAALVASALPSLANDPLALRSKIIMGGKPESLTKTFTASGRMVDAFRVLDATTPTAHAASAFGFVAGSVVTTTTIPSRSTWPAATDDLSGIQSYDTAVSTRGSSFKTQLAGTLGQTAYKTLTFKTPYVMRVRARDRAGNVSDWAIGRKFEPRIYQETTSFATYAGSWSSSLIRASSGGRERSATRAGASVTLRFTGQAFGIVATRGPSRGSAKAWVDGVYVGIVDLHASATKSRVVVLTRAWSSNGSHTVRLVVVGGGTHPRFDFDALVLMR